MQALDSVVRDFSRRPLDEIRSALTSKWGASNDTARITKPDLTNVATFIGNGKRFWIAPDGRIMADD